jgi:hypothetical protein
MEQLKELITDIKSMLQVISLNHLTYENGMITYQERQNLDKKAIEIYNKNCNGTLKPEDLMFNF